MYGQSKSETNNLIKRLEIKQFQMQMQGSLSQCAKHNALGYGSP